MKTTTISVNVYEVGDVIELKGESLRLVAKQRTFAECTKAIVAAVNQRADKMYTYRIIASNGKMMTLTPAEQGSEKYIGHIDLGLLLDGETAK